jgi:1,4-dihydroxy-6-naphthoate synthase
MKLTLAFSPCPNDTFMFDALVNHKIDTEGLEFEVVLEDIESLNRNALQHRYDITKLSFSALLYSHSHYALLQSGAALGVNCGPLFVCKKGAKNKINDNSLIGIPGHYTTAHSLFSLAYPNYSHKTQLVFSDIEQAILKGKIDAGVIIHENRFTYQENGLEKIQDLGEFWQNKTNLPIPLGGIAISRKLDLNTQLTFQKLLKKSIQFAFDHPESSENYVKQHAQEMEIEVRNKHINLYVNEYSLNLGNTGKQSVCYLFDQFHQANNTIFVEQ